MIATRQIEIQSARNMFLTNVYVFKLTKFDMSSFLQVT